MSVTNGRSCLQISSEADINTRTHKKKIKISILSRSFLSTAIKIPVLSLSSASQSYSNHVRHLKKSQSFSLFKVPILSKTITHFTKLSQKLLFYFASLHYNTKSPNSLKFLWILCLWDSRASKISHFLKVFDTTPNSENSLKNPYFASNSPQDSVAVTVSILEKTEQWREW